MSVLDFALFTFAGLMGGAVNAIAGGAKLFVFPLLLASGLSPLVAIVTATIALYPAQIPAAWVYRRYLVSDVRGLLSRMVPAILGGLSGAFALIYSTEDAFVAVVPFFLVTAVIVVAFGNRLVLLLTTLMSPRRMSALSIVSAYVVGFYGGYFGAGLGFLLIAVVLISGITNMQAANAEKNLLAFALNTFAIIPLLFSGLVNGVAAAGVIVGGLVGGFLGARLAQLLPDLLMRITVATFGFVLTMAFLFG